MRGLGYRKTLCILLRHFIEIGDMLQWILGWLAHRLLKLTGEAEVAWVIVHQAVTLHMVTQVAGGRLGAAPQSIIAGASHPPLLQ
jgi:hypothetical protein